jgi:hypothetical protein
MFRLKPSLTVPAALGLGLACLVSAADTTGVPVELLAQCAAMTAKDARLACYDALARRYAAGGARTASTEPAAASAPGADDNRNFGLSPAQIQQTPAGPPAIQAIQARISAISFNRGETGQAYLELDNGEIWRTRDDVGRLAAGDLVKIKRAALGSFLMLDPAKLSYRVYRVK